MPTSKTPRSAPPVDAAPIRHPRPVSLVDALERNPMAVGADALREYRSWARTIRTLPANALDNADGCAVTMGTIALLGMQRVSVPVYCVTHRLWRALSTAAPTPKRHKLPHPALMLIYPPVGLGVQFGGEEAANLLLVDGDVARTWANQYGDTLDWYRDCVTIGDGVLLLPTSGSWRDGSTHNASHSRGRGYVDRQPYERRVDSQIFNVISTMFAWVDAGKITLRAAEDDTGKKYTVVDLPTKVYAQTAREDGGVRRRCLADDLLDDRRAFRDRLRLDIIRDCNLDPKKHPPGAIADALGDTASILWKLAQEPTPLPVFVVDPDLWSELVQTDPPDDVPRLPYPTMLVLLPQGAGPELRPLDAPHDTWSMSDMLLLDTEHLSAWLPGTLGGHRGCRTQDCGTAHSSRPGDWRVLELSGSHGGTPPLSACMHTVSVLVDENDAQASESLAALHQRRGLRNLIALIVDRQLVRREQPDGPVLGNRKAALLARRGLSRRGYTLLSLTAPSQIRDASGDGAPLWQVRPHIRRGHWRRQHVLDAGEREVLERREREGKLPMLTVRQWVRPCVVGKGEVANREYKVTL